jgi:hypothetical protein
VTRQYFLLSLSGLFWRNGCNGEPMAPECVFVVGLLSCLVGAVLFSRVCRSLLPEEPSSVPALSAGTLGGIWALVFALVFGAWWLAAG